MLPMALLLPCLLDMDDEGLLRLVYVLRTLLQDGNAGLGEINRVSEQTESQGGSVERVPAPLTINPTLLAWGIAKQPAEPLLR